jgi:hypothetical protein
VPIVFRDTKGSALTHQEMDANWRYINQDNIREDLASTSSAGDGDALLGVKRSETDAVGTTQHARSQGDWLQVFDFMTPAEQADVLTATALVDVTAALNKALAAGKRTLFPPGKYLLSSTLAASGKTGLSLIGIGDVEFVINSAAGFTGASGAAPQTNCILYLSGCTNVVISGIKINPDTAAFAAAFPSGQWNHAIQLDGCKEVSIEHNDLKAPRGDGVAIGTDLGTLNEGITVRRNYIHDCYRIGAVVVQGRAVTINQNRIVGNKADYGSVYGEGIGVEPDNTAHICNDITIDDNKVASGGIYLVSRSALEGNTNNIRITKNSCDHIYVRGAESGEVAGNTIDCVPVDALGTATYGTGLWIFQTSAPGGKAGCNRKLNVHANTVNIANDATDPHPQAIGMVIGGLTDGQVHSNIVRNVGAGATSVTRGIQYIAGIRTSVKKNKVYNFTEAFYVDNLSSYNDSSLVGTDASEDVVVQDNEFYGLCFIRNNTAARITFKDNYVRQLLAATNSAVRVILTSGNIRVEQNDVFSLSTGTFGAIDVTGDTASLARVRGNTVEAAGQSGIAARSTIDDCQIDGNYILVPGGGASYPIELADTVVVSATDNKLDATSSATNAILCATGVTGRAAGNKLLQTFTAPFRFRNTAMNGRGQYVEVDQSPGAGGWANAQTWSAGQVAWNVPTAAAGDPAFVCTTAGSPGTWKAYANVDA